MKVLVTGGNGFIGRHIINELHSHGFEVVSFDVVQPKVRLDGVRYVFGTVMDKFSLERELQGCDAVFHLAAILGVKRADAELLKCLSINIEGTTNVLEACVMSKVPYVLLTSSSEVYGDIHKDKYAEDSPFNPKSGYAISKLAGEHYVKGFHKEFGMEFNIVRFFNVYGPGQVAEFVLPKFVKMVSRGIAPTVYDNGKQLRSFCHIKDASRAVVGIFRDKGLRNETFNVGNDTEPVEMAELARRILKKSDSDLEVNFLPFADSDRDHAREVYHRIPDISKIREKIGYEPRINLDEGIESLIQSGDIAESWVEPLH